MRLHAAPCGSTHRGFPLGPLAAAGEHRVPQRPPHRPREAHSHCVIGNWLGSAGVLVLAAHNTTGHSARSALAPTAHQSSAQRQAAGSSGPGRGPGRCGGAGPSEWRVAGGVRSGLRVAASAARW
jgi:hypothetical protein